MRAIAAVASGVLILGLTVAGLTLWGMQPHPQGDHAEFCFAEWCIAPDSMDRSGSSTLVHTVVRSSALAIAQRPDHPQAWLVDGQGRQAGGPQPALDRPVSPGQSFDADLSFATATSTCQTFVVAEGAWPRFLGLGYAPSPFTERASWRLCLSNAVGGPITADSWSTG